jgi:acyl-CoA hydrolase
MKGDRAGKTVSASTVVTTELAQPNDANHLGNIFGGKVLSMIDLAGAMAAMRHCRKTVVTASVERVDFKHPIRIGYLVIIEARLTAAFGTSVEVAVEIHSENPITGSRCKTCSARVTYVALDEAGRPASVPSLICETLEEKASETDARRRKTAWQKERKRDRCDE